MKINVKIVKLVIIQIIIINVKLDVNIKIVKYVQMQVQINNFVKYVKMDMNYKIIVNVFK